MFKDPIPTPAPIGTEYMPSGTEVLRNKLEEDFTKYSPVMWADPLLLYKLTIDTPDTIEWLPAIGVDVNNARFGTSRTLTLSALGNQIKAIVGAELSQTDAIRGIIPTPGLKDQKSVATLMHMSDIESVPSLDEAAIMRLLMLQTSTVDPVQQIYVSSSVNQMSINTYAPRKNCDLTWTKAIESTDNLQIGTQDSTSTLFFRTLDEYTALVAGNAMSNLQDKAKKDIDTSEVVFVPVRSCWRGQAWLVPYVLSFTTTAWWNHAITISAKLT